MSIETMSAAPSSPRPVPAAPAPFPGTVLIALPGLRNAAPVGGGCCAVAADDAVVEELASWPGIMVEKIDRNSETISVRIGPELGDRLSDAVDAVRDLGFPEAGIADRS